MEPVASAPQAEADLEAFRETALLAAAAAGAIQLGRFRTDLRVDEARPHDLKLEIDRECERAILGLIRGRHPEHALISEEKGVEDGAAPFCWVIDPLDGSVNYFNGLPWFCVSIACCALAPRSAAGESPLSRLAEGLVGVVQAAALDEVYVGVRGGGLFRNGARLPRLNPLRLEEAILSLSLGSREEILTRMLRLAGKLARRARKLRWLGATALELAYTACGNLDGVLLCDSRPWDIAAGRVLMAEAGGCVEVRPSAPERLDLIACAPGLLPELRRMVDAHD